MVEITPRTLWDSFALTYVYGRRRETPAMFPLFVAAYLPFSDGEIDWPGFQRVIARIYAAGAVPVVNADTGWAFLLTSEQKREVVRRVREWHPDKEIVVGVTPGANASTFDVRAYSAAVAEVKLDDRVRIMVMVSEGLLALRDDELVSAYGAIDGLGEGAIVHELTEEFVPFGRELSPYELHGVLRLPAFTAVKTSALSGPAILRRTVMCEQGGLRRGGKSVQVLSGVDWKVREAFEFADGILMGAAVLFPQLFARLVDLRREADDARTRAERWRYEDL
ncbi:MAG: hypothetical protein KDD69_19470, partial [Bdellovibrionales bacterium]|nr:hypothetical protein [Bdellovibrionales bacterium]